MPTMPNANYTHEIFIAKNADYLVYKLTSEERIYTMGICDRSKIFNVTTFTCDPCPKALKSFGIQDQICTPCG